MYCNTSSTAFTAVHCLQFKKGIGFVCYFVSDRTVEHLCLWLLSGKQSQTLLKHKPRGRDVGLKLNVLTQAVNKLHANCNQTEMIEKVQSDHKPVTMSAYNDSPQWKSHPFSDISPWQLSMDLQSVKTIINCCSYDCSEYEKNLLNFKQEKTSKENQTTLGEGGEGGVPRISKRST